MISAGPGAAQPIDDDGRQVFLPHVTEEMLTADFWIDRMAEAEPPSSPGEVRLTPHWTRLTPDRARLTPDEVRLTPHRTRLTPHRTRLTPDRARLTPDEVAAYSRLVLESSNGALQDLAAFPESLPRDELLRRTTSWKPGDPPFFRDGLEIDRTELDAVALNRNEAGILDSNPVRLGTTWQRCNLRMWPTAVPAFEEADDDRFDVFQATALDPAEPLVVLHESADQRWYFVRAVNCDGWLPKTQVALVPNRTDWLFLVSPERFLVVTGNRIELGADCGSPALEGTLFLMGARLPLWPEPVPATIMGRPSAGSHVVRLPRRDADGTARFAAVMVPDTGVVHKGYLPYTRANVISQAFRMLGQPYGWGGLGGTVDCSAFIAGVYRTLGLTLPRNSGRQEQIPGRRVVLGDERRRQSGLGLVPASASLFLQGHTLIYLGEVDGRHYVIHAMSAHMAAGDKIPVFGVVVSDLSLVRTSGVTLADSLTSAVDFVPPVGTWPPGTSPAATSAGSAAQNRGIGRE